MPFPRPRSRWLRTLRTRLTFWHTLLVVAAVLAALLAVREGSRYYLLYESEVVLNDEARELLLAIERLYPDQEQIVAIMQQKAAGHVDRGWYIRWLSEDRKQELWASEGGPTTPLTSIARSGSDYLVWTSGEFRSVERRLNVTGIPRYYVRVGTTTGFIETDINRLTRIAAPVALIIILLAPLGGFFLSQRAVRPLQEIITTTAQLRPSRLEERLTVRGVGDELDQLAWRINQFLDQIASHLRKNQDFVANAAHELRSPLSAILSSVEVSLEKQRTPEEYEELLFSIQEQCQHLSQVVNQLLQLTQSEASLTEIVLIPVSLEDIVRRAVEMFQPVAEEQHVALVLDVRPVPQVCGQKQQLRQLVTNLVDNAIKFTPAGGTVTLRLREEPSSREVVLDVADTGIGIGDQDLGRIFERFFQADRSRSRLSTGPIRGNGLGLSICEAIARQHGGTIEVVSHLGEGTTFTVRLPAVTA